MIIFDTIIVVEIKERFRKKKINFLKERIQKKRNSKGILKTSLKQ